MNENRLTGVGAPTRRTVGVVGQHYEDTNTGNIYECLVASEQSKLNLGIGGGYVWKKLITGDDRQDHAAIFGSGGPQMVEKVLIDEQEATFGDNYGVMTAVFPGVSALKEGQTYQVEIDGNKFSCVAGSFAPNGETYVYIGNAKIAPDAVGAEDTGEPFFAVSTDGALLVMVDFPTTYGSVPDIVCAIKITTMEEKSSNSGGGLFVVNVTSGESGVASDKTFEEIVNAFESGMYPVVSDGHGDVCHLNAVFRDGNTNIVVMEFYGLIMMGDGSCFILVYTFDVGGNVEYREATFTATGPK